MSDQPGLLLAFDGLDSSGKETQTKRLIERLRTKNRIVHMFETPDYTLSSGRELKKLLQNAAAWHALAWPAKMRLFADNRREHRDEVAAALGKGEIVIYDRYVPSSLAFMTLEAHPQTPSDTQREQVYKIVEEYEYEHNQMPIEQISIFLDVPPGIATTLLEKRKQKFQHDGEYTDHISIQQRLYNEYDVLCQERPQEFLRIKCVVNNQLLSIDDVGELVWDGLMARFPQLAISL